MENMIQAYQEALAKVRQAIKDTQFLPKLDRVNQEQLRILRSMERDLLWTFKQIKRETPSQNSYVQRSKERREIPIDPQSFDFHVYQSAFAQPKGDLSPRDWLRLQRVLLILTPHEREIYCFHRGEGFSYQEIATMFGVSKEAVKKSLLRAEKKIQKRVKALKVAELCGKQRMNDQTKVEKSS